MPRHTKEAKNRQSFVLCRSGIGTHNSHSTYTSIEEAGGCDTGFCPEKKEEKNFAKGADRDQIRSCSEIGLSLEDFISILS
jgi:hypothetical protein